MINEKLAKAIRLADEEYHAEMSPDVFTNRETVRRIETEGNTLMASEPYKHIRDLRVLDGEALDHVIVVAMRFGMRIQRKLDSLP